MYRTSNLSLIAPYIQCKADLGTFQVPDFDSNHQQPKFRHSLGKCPSKTKPQFPHFNLFYQHAIRASMSWLPPPIALNHQHTPRETRGPTQKLKSKINFIHSLHRSISATFLPKKYLAPLSVLFTRPCGAFGQIRTLEDFSDEEMSSPPLHGPLSYEFEFNLALRVHVGLMACM